MVKMAHHDLALGLLIHVIFQYQHELQRCDLSPSLLATFAKFGITSDPRHLPVVSFAVW